MFRSTTHPLIYITYKEKSHPMSHALIDNLLAKGTTSIIYTCSQDHIHIQYKDINISITVEDFIDFAQTMSHALTEWSDLDVKGVLQSPPEISV